jgi:hypothetical protein
LTVESQESMRTKESNRLTSACICNGIDWTTAKLQLADVTEAAGTAHSTCALHI